MSICPNDSSATFTVTYPREAGIIIKYPTDGTEDRYGVNTGWTEKFLPKHTDYRVEQLEGHGVTYVWGTATGRFYLEMSDGSTRRFCHRTVYWMSRWGNVPADAGFEIYNEGMHYRYRVKRSDTEGVSDAVYWCETSSQDSETFVPLEDSEITTDEGMVKFYPWYGNHANGYPRPDCVRAVRGNHDYEITPGSMQISSIERPSPFNYYTSFTLAPANPSVAGSTPTWTSASTRTVRPISIEQVEAQNAVLATFTATKQETEDFYVYSGRGVFRLSLRNKTTGRYTRIREITSPDPQAVVSYTYTCGSSGCPENTCEVTCGDTICCYGSDGIAVSSFPVS